MAPSIQDEIKQRKPFSSLEEETALALARTSDLIQRRAAELFKSYGITGTQYNVLRILRGAGSEGIPCSEIGERMVTRDPDITRLLDRMEKLQLCARARDSKDRRVILSHITPKGMDLLRQLDRPVAELNRKVLGHMGASRLRSLCRLLEAARGG
jgi:DNA-binding MarR family transcriptional regulator